MPRLALAALIALAGTPAWASGTIGYGSRAGMEVDVVSMSGLDTPRAIIRTKHTRENATTFCREYIGKVTDECIRGELATRINGQITGNCATGEFTTFFGDRFRFAGRSRVVGGMAKYRLINVGTGEEADGSSASGYPVNMQLFRALCPRRAPVDP